MGTGLLADQTLANGKGGKGGGIVEIQFVHQIGPVFFYRFQANAKVVRNVLIFVRMHRILMVEDDSNFRQTLRGLLAFGFPAISIEEAGDFYDITGSYMIPFVSLLLIILLGIGGG